MKALNVLLALAISAALALGILEIGLRVLGGGPQPTINRFDKDLGWAKTPGAETRRGTSEFDVTFKINSLGLRDDPMAAPTKPRGTCRVLMLGDSFVLGYTVDRQDLFVDVLEQWWKAEGRPVDVINAGTEGYSTDQEVLWLAKHGRDFQPDVVVLFPYENDLYWNAKTQYDRYPKPRFNPSGESERIVLADPGPPPASDRWAIGRFLNRMGRRADVWSPNGDRHLPMEYVAYFPSDPEPMPQAKLRTRGALLALQKTCAGLGAWLCAVPIPNKACIEPGALKDLEKTMRPSWIARTFYGRKEVDRSTWSPDLPVETFLALCDGLRIPTLDPREALRAAAKAADGGVYHAKDWHLNPEGNRALARFVHDEFARANVLASGSRTAEMPLRAPDDPWWTQGWVKLFAVLWAALSLVWIFTYRKDPAWQAPLKVGVMLALVFGIALGGDWLLRELPPGVGTLVALLFVLVLLGFILWKLGRRIGTIVELFVCFVGRGHWYLIPLVVVLLTVGSLLVVAASSPLVAPFIYTLF